MIYGMGVDITLNVDMVLQSAVFVCSYVFTFGIWCTWSVFMGGDGLTQNVFQ